MKKMLFLFALLLPAFNGLFAQGADFEIKIIQDSVCLPDAGNVVLLEKKKFTIQVLLNGIEGVYLFAAFNDSIYRITDGEQVPGFSDVPAMSMAENSFNPDEELIVSDEGWAYWFYNKKENWHRFDKKLTVKGRTVTAYKTIRQFYFPPEEKVLPVKDVQQPLYLFFFSAASDKNFSLVKERARYKIKINWR